MILIVAEKPSVGRVIASVVGAEERHEGYIQGSGYIVSWCLGHLVTLQAPNDYNNGWQDKWNFSQLPMIPENWQFKVTENTRKQFDILKNLMNDSRISEIICATDADREGENIFRYVCNMAKCKKPVNRLWVSSLEESAVRQALNQMKPSSDYDNLFQAGFCRARADWLVGMNASRLFSCRYRGNLSIGRVQTPTLAMIVQRDHDVENFVKQKYFTADLVYDDIIFSSEKIEDEESADKIISECTGKAVVIRSLNREMKIVNAPKLYDLTTLQREANKAYGYTAQQTLDCIQSLYEAKLVTYPRTDSQYITSDMEQTALDMVNISAQIYSVKLVHMPDICRCINNSKVTGHHAIIPTANISTADISALPTGEKNILKMIAMKLICVSAPPYKYESVRITAECNGNLFTATGKLILENGWKIYEKSDEKDFLFPDFAEEQTFSAVPKKCEHFTSPPKSYTEDMLLSAMEHAGNFDDEAEKKGLGTPATRAGVIENLVTKGYAERKGRQIFSTEKGRNLIAVIPDEIKSAKLTSDWEMKLQQIEHGNYSANDFMNEIENFVRELCKKYGSEDENICFSDKKSESIGKCPKCGNDIICGKYGFFCKSKCGMNVAKVYGRELSEEQLKALLDGKSISYTSNGRKTVVLPQVAQNDYKGKTYYQWATGKEK